MPGSDDLPITESGDIYVPTSGLEDYSLEEEQNETKFDLNALDQAGLLALRDKIDAKIEGLALSEVNLVKETLLQLQKAKVLQTLASEKTSGTPMNQRAQVQNSIASILDKLGKIQMELYDSEKLKRLLAATVKIVKELPKEQQIAFFEAMETDFAVAEAEAAA